jgi:hypothetical protein
MRAVRLKLVLVMLVVPCLVTACSSDVTTSTGDVPGGDEQQYSKDCQLVVDTYAEADSLWRGVFESASRVFLNAEAVVEGRNRNDDFNNNRKFMREWEISSARDYPRSVAGPKYVQRLTESTALLWPKVDDPDLKSVLREFSLGNFQKANWSAVLSICPPPEGSFAGDTPIME